ncbi:MAG: fructosamine kinase family protein, partial [Synechococcaceae cyanobacterium RL_1_2]|nr:fructosamine kinase family protein [Synechococcaceae cyanobacterium RL_1_2]
MGFNLSSNQNSWNAIAGAVTKATGQAFVVENQVAISGGSINQSYRIEGGESLLFCEAQCTESEHHVYSGSHGTQAMAATNTIKNSPGNWLR